MSITERGMGERVVVLDDEDKEVVSLVERDARFHFVLMVIAQNMVYSVIEPS